MVQIIRDQMRNYTPDLSTANKNAVVAESIGQLKNTLDSMMSFAGAVQKEQKASALEAEKSQKQLELDQKAALAGMEEADTRMIDTQIGSVAQTELMRWNVENIAAGIDPTTDEYSQKLIAKREEIYRPYIEKMSTQKGRDKLMKQGLDTQERLRQSNIGKIAENRKRAAAQQAFAKSAQDMQTDARDFGKNGDWKGFQDATKDTRDAMVDYLAKQGEFAAKEAALAQKQATIADVNAEIQTTKKALEEAKLANKKAQADKLKAQLERQKAMATKRLEDAERIRNVGKGKNSRSEKPGLTELINDLGMAEDEAQIQFFDKIDGYVAQGLSEEEAVQKTFDDNSGNKFGDVSTLKDFYDMYKGRYPDMPQTTLKQSPAELRKEVYQQIEMTNPGATEEEKEKIFQEIYPEQKVVEKAQAKKKKAKRSKKVSPMMVAESVEVNKKMAKGGKEAKEAAEFVVDSATQESYMAGMAEEDPLKVIKMAGDKETLDQVAKEKLEDAKYYQDQQLAGGFMSVMNFMGNMPGLSLIKSGLDYSAKSDAEAQIKEGRQELYDNTPDSIKKVKSDIIIQNAQERKAELEARRKSLAKGSEAYDIVDSQIKEQDAIIADPTEQVIDSLQQDLSNTVLADARKNRELQRLDEKKMQQAQTVESYQMVLSPDKAVSDAANFALALGQPAAEELFNMSITPEAMEKARERFNENENKISFNTQIEFEATQDVADSLANIVNYQGNNPLEIIKYAMDVQSDLAESANMTQTQKDNVRKILGTVVQDRVFGDMVSDIMSSNNRYFPDTSWFENIFVRAVDVPEISEQIGLVSSNIADQDIDTVNKYIKVETARVVSDTIGMLAVASQIQNPDERRAATIEAGNYLAQEKRKIYDHVMDSYGIDMVKLREVKREKGQAFTQVGAQLKEYMGDDPSTGEPIWRDYVNKENSKMALKRILDLLNAIQSGEK